MAVAVSRQEVSSAMARWGWPVEKEARAAFTRSCAQLSWSAADRASIHGNLWAMREASEPSSSNVTVMRSAASWRSCACPSAAA
jgi:hypothetical protein